MTLHDPNEYEHIANIWDDDIVEHLLDVAVVDGQVQIIVMPKDTDSVTLGPKGVKDLTNALNRCQTRMGLRR